jgi:polyhydroxybutyrate depolymerase
MTSRFAFRLESGARSLAAPVASALALGVALAPGCSSGDSDTPGYDKGNDAGVDVFAGGDAFAWPDADPAPDAGPGPSPGFDAGADAAPSAVTCSDKTGEKGGVSLSVDSGGTTRTALLHVPDAYDATKGTLLVLNFHGFLSAGWQQELLTRMDSESDTRGFIVAYPEGVAASWNAGDCCGTAWTDSVKDVQFVRDLLDEIEQRYCIDDARVFATGMSNGGFFSHRLACEASDRIAAVAPVAGVLGIDPSTCQPSRHVPILDFHGSADPLVPYDGGTPLVPQLGAGLVFRSVPDTMEFWRAYNDCSAFSATFYQKGDATCVRWPDCAGGAETALCTIQDGGHTWPGGVPIPAGKTSSDISATATMLDFFEAHPM